MCIADVVPYNTDHPCESRCNKNDLDKMEDSWDAWAAWILKTNKLSC